MLVSYLMHKFDKKIWLNIKPLIGLNFIFQFLFIRTTVAVSTTGVNLYIKLALLLWVSRSSYVVSLVVAYFAALVTNDSIYRLKFFVLMLTMYDALVFTTIALLCIKWVRYFLAVVFPLATDFMQLVF